MNSNGNRIFLVGIEQDDHSVKNVKAFQNETWAIKYGNSAGVAARYAEVEIEWSTVAPAPRVVAPVVAKVVKTGGKTSNGTPVTVQ